MLCLNYLVGESYKLSITVPQCTSVANVSTALFLNDKGFPTKTITLKNVGGRRGKCIFYEQITMPPDVSNVIRQVYSYTILLRRYSKLAKYSFAFSWKSSVSVHIDYDPFI